LIDYEAILFDFDGVLVDSEPVHYACWVEVLKQFNISLPWEEYCARCIGLSDREMSRFLYLRADPPISLEQLWAEYPRKKAMARDRMLEAGLFSGEVARLLHDLSARYKLGVVTSSGKTEVEPILASAGVLPLLGATVYGSDVQRHKPAPDPYLLALERLEVSRALVVEDSQFGVEAGRAAGLDVLHIPSQTQVCHLVRTRLNAVH
jgi:HAD superfamily hydrolase (TIGR01509 family)